MMGSFEAQQDKVLLEFSNRLKTALDEQAMAQPHQQTGRKTSHLQKAVIASANDYVAHGLHKREVLTPEGFRSGAKALGDALDTHIGAGADVIAERRKVIEIAQGATRPGGERLHWLLPRDYGAIANKINEGMATSFEGKKGVLGEDGVYSFPYQMKQKFAGETAQRLVRVMDSFHDQALLMARGGERESIAPATLSPRETFAMRHVERPEQAQPVTPLSGRAQRRQEAANALAREEKQRADLMAKETGVYPESSDDSGAPRVVYVLPNAHMATLPHKPRAFKLFPDLKVSSSEETDGNTIFDTLDTASSGKRKREDSASLSPKLDERGREREGRQTI